MRSVDHAAPRRERPSRPAQHFTETLAARNAKRASRGSCTVDRRLDRSSLQVAERRARKSRHDNRLARWLSANPSIACEASAVSPHPEDHARATIAAHLLVEKMPSLERRHGAEIVDDSIAAFAVPCAVAAQHPAPWNPARLAIVPAQHGWIQLGYCAGFQGQRLVVTRAR